MTTETTTRFRPQSLTESESSLLAADKASFELTTDQRLKTLEKSLAEANYTLQNMRLRNGLANYFASEMGNFLWAFIVAVAAISTAIGLVIWSMRPPSPDTDKQLCGIEYADKFTANVTNKHSLVILKPDGTSTTMPVGSCATIVKATAPTVKAGN